jgi:hypothetical protein
LCTKSGDENGPNIVAALAGKTGVKNMARWQEPKAEMLQENERPKTRNGKVRLRSLEDLDKRSTAYRHVHELVAAITNDLGGPNTLSTSERLIIEDAAFMSTICKDRQVLWLQGKEIDVNAYVTTANCVRRNLETVGLERRAKDVTAEGDLLRRFNEELQRQQAATP